MFWSRTNASSATGKTVLMLSQVFTHVITQLKFPSNDSELTEDGYLIH